MACCSGSGDCPMHGANEPGAGPNRVVTQAQAASCWAASDASESTPSAVAFSLSLSAAPVPGTLSIFTTIVAPPSSSDAWRTHLPLPLGQVPKHVLLSVFLI